MGSYAYSGVSAPIRRLRRWILGGAARLLIGIYVAIILIPLYYLVISSFKKNDAIFLNALSLPDSFSFANFLKAQDGADLLAAMANSFIITGGAGLLTLILAVPAAFAIARIPVKASPIVERIFSLGFLLPAFAVLVPTFILSIILNLFHSALFLILFYPAMALPLSVILIAQFMRSIPIEIEEAARVDGATRWYILQRIFIPLSLPGIATVVILNFLSFWNEYLFARIILGDEWRTIQVALPTLKSFQVTDYGLVTAGTLIALVPVYIVYAILQKRMQEALVSGYAKG